MAKQKYKHLYPGSSVDSNSDRGFQKGTIDIPISKWQADGASAPADGTYGTNAQSVFDTKDFDQTTDEVLHTALKVPADYGGGLKLVIDWNINVGDTTKAVVWDATINALDAADTVDAAGSGATAVTVACTGTAYQLIQTEIDLDISTETLTPGKLIGIMLFRDANHASDTATADALLLGSTLLYDKSA